MRFCVTYTNSHQPFFEKHFMKSFPFEEDVSLVLEKMPQKCEQGRLFSEGWRDQMIEKQKFINKCLTTFFLDEILVFSDVDVRFYGNVKDDLIECLGDHDIAFMKDHNSDEVGRCGGFFILKSCDKIRGLFSEVLSILQSFDPNDPTSFETSEQQTINSVLRRRTDVRWKYLPPRYYTHGLYTQGLENFTEQNQSGLWWENKSSTERDKMFVAQDLKVHHANWSSGIDNKLELLDFVLKQRGMRE